MNVATSYYDVRSSCLACTFRWPRVHEERNGSPVMLRRCIFLVSTFENFFLRSHLLPRPFPSGTGTGHRDHSSSQIEYNLDDKNQRDWITIYSLCFSLLVETRRIIKSSIEQQILHRNRLVSVIFPIAVLFAKDIFWKRWFFVPVNKILLNLGRVASCRDTRFLSRDARWHSDPFHDRTYFELIDRWFYVKIRRFSYSLRGML